MKYLYTVVSLKNFPDIDKKKQIHFIKGDVTVKSTDGSYGFPIEYMKMPSGMSFHFYIGVVETEFPEEFPLQMRFIKFNQYYPESLNL